MSFVSDVPLGLLARYLAYASLLIIFTLLFLQKRTVFHAKLPQNVKGDPPIVGTLQFFSARWDFFRGAIAASRTGQFTFHVGKHTVVGTSGAASRETYFESP